MKHALSWMLGFIASGLSTLVSIPAYADAVGPYYANPSWDQTLPASTRFIVLSNMNSAAVLDRETGLTWQRTPKPSAVAWLEASDLCIANSFGSGRFGWRLPTVQELDSLLDPSATSGPPLPAGHPFIGISSEAAFWTATTSAADSSQAFIVFWTIDPFSLSFIFQTDLTAGKSQSTTSVAIFTSIQAWCVRGGGLQAAPQ